jgi:hypothetical protein
MCEKKQRENTETGSRTHRFETGIERRHVLRGRVQRAQCGGRCLGVRVEPRTERDRLGLDVGQSGQGSDQQRAQVEAVDRRLRGADRRLCVSETGEEKTDMGREE